MRSSPQVGFSLANRRTISRRFGGKEGRPHLRDFHFQNCRNTLRCHLRKVAGFTITSAPRQSKNRARAIIVNRNRGVVLDGLVLRSWNRASCLRRNRISASRAARDEKANRTIGSNFHFTSSLCRPLLCRTFARRSKNRLVIAFGEVESDSTQLIVSPRCKRWSRMEIGCTATSSGTTRSHFPVAARTAS